MHDLTTCSPRQQRTIAPARLQDELNTAASGDFQALRQRLKRAEAANADLEQVSRSRLLIPPKTVQLHMQMY